MKRKKRCAKCGLEKLRADFAKNSSYCKPCLMQYKRDWKVANKDKVHQHRSTYRAQLKEKLLSGNQTHLFKSTIKTCTRCKLTKPVSQFDRIYKGIDYFSYWCSSCKNERRRFQRTQDTWREKYGEKHRQYCRDYRLKLKKIVLDHYGNKCICCGERQIEFLTIDHISGGGSEHRRLLKTKGGTKFYRWLKINNFPAGYQILCFNCNSAKGFYGTCPHSYLVSVKQSLLTIR